MSCVQKYLVGFIVLTSFATLAYASGENSLSFPTPLETYGDDEILRKKGLMEVLSTFANIFLNSERCKNPLRLG